MSKYCCKHLRVLSTFNNCIPFICKIRFPPSLMLPHKGYFSLSFSPSLLLSSLSKAKFQLRAPSGSDRGSLQIQFLCYEVIPVISRKRCHSLSIMPPRLPLDHWEPAHVLDRGQVLTTHHLLRGEPDGTVGIWEETSGCPPGWPGLGGRGQGDPSGPEAHHLQTRSFRH